MPGAHDLFKQLVAQTIAPILQRDHFHRKSAFFWKRSLEGNWGVVEVQRSRKSSAERVIFTMNLGVGLGTVLAFENKPGSAPPPIDRCQWSQRVGFLLPEHQDRWWTLVDEGNLDRISDEMRGALNDFVLPAINRLLSETVLMEALLRRESPGLTEASRLITLSILLKKTNRQEALTRVMSELRAISAGRPTQGMVERHLKRLAEWHCQ